MILINDVPFVGLGINAEWRLNRQELLIPDDEIKLYVQLIAYFDQSKHG
ncbi:hypothetical protein SAMN06265219_11151 [Gracilimonas mengyeensis]|uniref:Uncharacterized protein n=1 Tax=Gracilimonas mengyeensis TaxID=1302730 RepID=A0A521E9Y3_9BACT|nr:hypothetical protein SAMN06265219_11151 [Gracilimonas mengyeensis]